MTTAILDHFDTLAYVTKSKKLGADENLAKYQARQIEQAIAIAVNTARTDIENKELATKQDIKNLELATKQDIKNLEVVTKHDIKNLEVATKHDIKKLETHMQKFEMQMQKRMQKLEVQIHQSKFEIVIWIFGLLIASGIVQHFVK